MTMEVIPDEVRRHAKAYFVGMGLIVGFFLGLWAGVAMENATANDPFSWCNSQTKTCQKIFEYYKAMGRCRT